MDREQVLAFPSLDDLLMDAYRRGMDIEFAAAALPLRHGDNGHSSFRCLTFERRGPFQTIRSKPGIIGA